MGNPVRKYFNEKASSWDGLINAETLQRLKKIVGELSLAPGCTVLDVGAGTGILFPFLLEAVGPRGRIFALDVAEEMLLRARAKYGKAVYYVVGDIACAPFSDASFDEVICNSCFPHVADKPKAAREMARLLRPGGRATICHTMSREAVNALHASLGGVVGDHFLPGEAEMRDIFAAAGFKKIKAVNAPEYYLFVAYK